MELNIFGALKHQLLTHYQFFLIAIFKCLNVLEWHRLMARIKCWFVVVVADSLEQVARSLSLSHLGLERIPSVRLKVNSK